MRIIDQNGQEIENADFSKGYYLEDTIVIAHHPAQSYIPEQFHYETVARYPSGGRDVVKVIDVPEQEAREAWDETENILRWYWYTQEEIDARSKYPDMKAALDILGVSE